MAIQFYLNGQICRESRASPSMTVLDYLRICLGKTGTKEGCGEGDCGACSVVLIRDNGGEPVYEVVNSCLLTISHIDGGNLVTVEGLDQNQDLDPVQTAMVETNGSQCGFCTPGFIMALYSLRQGSDIITDDIIHDALAGNLCRCTGYRPIIDAAKLACEKSTGTPFEKLKPIRANSQFQNSSGAFFAPCTWENLIDIYSQNPDATLLAGGTDLGLPISKDREALQLYILTTKVDKLNLINNTSDYLEIGSSVTYTKVLPYIEKLYPSFASLIIRIGSRQIRNVATIGGNIGTASPIGDTLPCLIALDATLVLGAAEGEREIPIGEFFLGYRKTDLRAGEVIKCVRIPKLKRNQEFRVYKVSKRFDQDISSVVAAFLVEFDDQTVSDIRIAYGGMSAIPMRAKSSENVLIGNDLTEITASQAGLSVSKDFTPLTDFRGSKEYRLKVAHNLFIRLYRDIVEHEELLEEVAP